MFGCVVIPGGGLPPNARFLLDDCVMGNKGEADLGLPPGIFKGSWCSGLSSCTMVPDTTGTAGWYGLLPGVCGVTIADVVVGGTGYTNTSSSDCTVVWLVRLSNGFPEAVSPANVPSGIGGV